MDLGLSQEELRELVIERAAKKIVEDTGGDSDISDVLEGRIERRFQELIAAAIEPVTAQIASGVIEPKVQALVEGMTFQKHTSWGEPKEPPRSWRELLVERAENWLIEPVNYRGQTQDEVRRSGSCFNKDTTRIAWMVDSHIKTHIETAMRAALLDANKKLAAGIMDAVRDGLNAAAAGIKVEVKTGR